MSAAPLTELFDKAPLNSFHKRLIIYSSGGPFLDGYVLSIIGMALVQATHRLHLSLFWEGMIGASALIGVFLGGFSGGWFTDKYGRQILYTIDLIVIGVFSLAQYWVESAPALFILRLVIGIAVGADYPIATSLLAEFAPQKCRGPFVGFLLVMWFVGAAVGYIVGDILLRTGHSDAWRWMLASAALPAAVFLFLRRNTPESPRWLLQAGRLTEVKDVLKLVYNRDIPLEELAASMTGAAEAVSSTSTVSALFKSGYGARILFVTVFWTCAVVPLFAVYAFAPKIMAALGLAGSMGNLGATAITVLFMLGCIPPLFIINKKGRRFLLLNSFFWSGIALLLLGLFPDSSQHVILLLFSSYALAIGGTQTLQFVYPNELFPTEIRATAVGLASSLSRIGAALGTYCVPFALVHLGIGPTMLAAAVVTLVGFAVSWRMAPETKNCSLEEAACLYAESQVL